MVQELMLRGDLYSALADPKLEGMLAWEKRCGCMCGCMCTPMRMAIVYMNDVSKESASKFVHARKLHVAKALQYLHHIAHQ